MQPVSIWGVLLTQSRGPAVVRSHGELLGDSCDGVAIVEASSAGNGRASHTRTRLDGLLAGLREIPDEAGLVALVDEDGADAVDPDTIGQMIARLTDDMAAIVRGIPVTDALKRVEGRQLLGGVDRSGLFAPQTPQLIRREALDDALLAACGQLPSDPATLLVDCGHSVGVLWGSAPSGVPLPPRNAQQPAR